MNSGLVAYYGFEQAGSAGLANQATGATAYDAERIGDGDVDWLAGAHPTGPGFEGNPAFDGGNGLSDRSTLISGKALNLGGDRDERVRIPLGTPELGQSFTIAAWHYLAPGAANTNRRFCVFEAETNYDISWGTLDMAASGGPLAAHNYAAWFANRSDSSLSVNGVPAGAWHHIVHVFTREGTGTRMTVFLNGSQVGSKVFSPVNMTFAAIKLGDARDGQNRTWDGMIDEVAIWDRALSADEVTALHHLYMTGQTVLDHTAGPTGFAGGAGVAGDPFLIETAEQLNAMRLNLGAHYRLEADLDLTAAAGWNGGQGWLPVGSSYSPFQGTFDGNGHTISGLTISRPNAEFQGLFGSLNGATVRNVRLEDVSVQCNLNTGGLAGEANNSTIENAHVSGQIGGGNHTGGLVGNLVGGSSLVHASSVSTVSGVSSVGGLVGRMAGGGTVMRYSCSYGSVEGSENTGGLLGMIWESLGVIDCYSQAAVDGGSGNEIGGLVGRLYSGWNHVVHSYSAGAVSGTGSNVGGLIGLNAGTVVDSYWNTETSGRVASAGGIGRTTAEMRQRATFANYNFHALWQIEEGAGYPEFKDLTLYVQPTAVALADLDGEGTVENPYLITNANELNAIRQGLDKHYVLAADIDLTDTVVWNNGQGWAPIGNTASGQHFTGSFDGNGHSISNLRISRPATDFQGLFGYVNGGRIGGLTVVGFDITAQDRSGGLAGQIEYGGVVSNCTSSGMIAARTRSGGLVGALQHGSRIEYSSSSARVIGSSERIGGLAGQSWTDSLILECSATGTVSGTAIVGGLIGYNVTRSRIEDSHATGAVTGSGNSVGGLAGQNDEDCVITGSHATGAVDGVHYVGGLVGYNLTRSRIEDSHAVGTVTGSGSTVGGLVGYSLTDCVIVRSHAMGTVSGVSSVGGLVGCNQTRSRIEDSHATGEVTATNERSGGLVGYSLTDCVILRSHATGAINGTARVGGLVGYHGGDSRILDCFATSAATGTGNQVGGLIGYNEHSRVLRSVGLGSAAGSTRVGGLVGEMAGDRAWVEQSYARGAAQGTGLIGGLVGSLAGGRVIECYSVGAVSGANNVGGLVGSATAGTRIERSYWNVTTSGQATSAGDGGHGGQPAERMVLPATYVGWDFATTWGIGHEGQYSEPYLLAGESGHIVGVSLEAPWAHPVRVTGLDGVGNTLAGHYVYHPGETGEAESGTTFQWYRGLTANGPFDLIPEATGTTWVQTGADAGRFLKFEVTVRDTAGRADVPRGAVHLFLDGTGREDAPWQIATPVQLNNLREFLGAAFWEQHFRLVEDIDLGIAPWNEGDGWVPIGTSATAFHGRLDGGGKAIRGLTIVRPGTNYQGLFGVLNGAVVQHLALEDAAVQGSVYVGALAGATTGSTLVDRVTVTGGVQGGTYTGGAVGHAGGSSALHGVIVDAVVQGSQDTGGVAGRLDGSAVTLYHSAAKGAVRGTSSVGGLVGVLSNYALLSDCFSWAEVEGGSNAGGLIGYVYYAYVRRSYSAGLVTGTGSNFGGFVGLNSGGSAVDCYWDTETSGRETSSVGTPRTSEQMADRANYRQWNFNTLWTFQDEDAPPVFQDLSMHDLPRSVRLADLAGDGSAGNPYQIGSLDALNAMRDDLTAHYRLTADIEMAATVVWNGGRGWQPIGAAVAGGRFSGRFDGGGHQVSNLTINRPLTDYQGLFGQTENGHVEFLRIHQAEVRGQTHAAAAVGSAIGSSVLHALTVDATVQGASEIGGVAGRLDGSSVTLYHSAAKGTVRGTSSVGGLVGLLSNYAMVSDCFSWAEVEGGSNVGGLIGYLYYAYVRRSYSAGLVTGTGSNFGGFVGLNSSGSAVDCYWDTGTSGRESSPVGTGLPSATLQQRTTFRNWNFFTLWSIEEGAGYPELNDLSSLSRRQNLTIAALQGGHCLIRRNVFTSTSTG